MATTGMYKLDDGTSYPTNCFPARSLLRPRYQEGAGHWQVAQWTAEQTKMELLFGTKHPQVKWKGQEVLKTSHLDDKTLDRAQLIKIHHVKTPSDLCSVNISNQNFVLAKEEDFEQFTSVAYITATENLLTLGAFRTFPELRELELSLNGLRNLNIKAGDFPHLEVLDLSYNNLSPEDVQVLGVLPQLKVLHLTANGLNSLPPDMAIPESKSCPKFPALEVLLLDDNHLSHPDVFVSLANLRSLKQLNLDKNGIRQVPYLHYISNSRFSIHPLSAKSGIKEGLRSRKTARKQQCQDGSQRVSEKPEYIILQSTKDPNKTEVVLPSWSPEPTGQEDSVPTGDTPKTSSASGVSSDFMLPLPELRFLSLADNEIEHEEDLLAVTLFPSLTELTFYGNPFTMSRSGDPPLLTSFLQNKLGIKMVRKKISKLEKPRIFIPIKANRKITSRLPKVQKHRKMIEAPPETTFWQLWTGDDLLEARTSLPEDGSLPLPVIHSISTPISSDFQILSTLEKGDISRPYSREGSFSEVTSLSSDDQLLVQSYTGSGSSLDRILFEDVPEAKSSLEQMLFESLLPSVKPQVQMKVTPLSKSHLMEQVQLKLIPPAQDQLAPVTSVQMPSTERDLSECISPTSGLLPPPNSPLQQEDSAAHVPASQVSPEHHELPETLVTFEQDQSWTVPPPPNSLLPEQNLSKPDLSTEPRTEEWSGAESFPPDSSLSEEDLPEGFPTTGSPAVTQRQLELMAGRLDLSEPPSLTRDAPGTGLPASSPEGQVPEEPVPPARSASQAEDLSKPLPPVHLLPAEQDPLESVLLPVSSVQGQNPSESFPPGGLLAGQQGLTGAPLASAGPHLPQTSIPRRLVPEDQPWVEPGPPTSPAFQETSQMETEPHMRLLSASQESLRHSPATTSFPSSQENLLDGFPPLEPTTALKDPLQSSSLSQSSSRELYQIFARLYREPTPSRVSPSAQTLSSREELLERVSSREELLEREKPESFFMTQVDEASGPSLQPVAAQTSKDEMTGAHPAVPEKYRGYEELLGKDPGPDFIEPVGIQHNVQALEKALRYPRVYRDSKARLDSIQKRYVPAPKKVPRVLPQQPQQDKVERLEEILLRLRDPTNIVHMPLVCILQKKKDNWCEYREALALLKEFREEYKATVAACQESASKSRRLAGADQKNQCQMFGPLPEIKVSAPDSDLDPNLKDLP